MDSVFASFDGDSLGFVENLYALYLEDPESVDPHWRKYLASLAVEDLGDGDRADLNGSRPVSGPSFRPSSIFNPPGGLTAGSAAVEEGDEIPTSPETLAERIPFMKSIRLLQGVSEKEVGELAKLVTEHEIQDGHYVFRQGETGDALYVVLEGNVVVWRDEDLVVVLGPGEVVGEMAVLDQAPRIADAIARGRVRLLRLRAQDLHTRLDREPALARGLLRGLTRRLRARGTQQSRVDQLVRAYRVRGHLRADLNPLSLPRATVQELELEHWGLSEKDLDTLFASSTIPGTFILPLKEIIQRMQESYCGSIGVEYMHLDRFRRKQWLQYRLEDPATRRVLTVDEQRRILTKLTDAEIFEDFVSKKFLGAKRFSAEGAETLIPLLDQVIDEGGSHGLREIVIAMAHRGRLNVLANTMDKSPAAIFREFGDQDGEKYRGRGDVKYHLGYSSDRALPSGGRLHLSLCFNPSHLEFVGPVAQGRLRAKQDRIGDLERRKGMAVVIHGDAAFAGQGVVQEMLNLSDLPGYTTGGTLHIVVNNQLGFTTPPESGRSTRYATDVAKMLQSPIFHVNGEHPEAVAQVIRVAMDYRREFASDVVIDMYCYRRHGHNEGDEPAFTQPVMYQIIRQRKSVREGYLDSLLQLGDITRDEAEGIVEERRAALEKDLERARDPKFEHSIMTPLAGAWKAYRGGADAAVPPADTNLAVERCRQLLQASCIVPGQFHVHPKLKKGLLDSRRDMAEGNKPLDWGAGEALAFASLVTSGVPVRLTGQDSGRGTFSHRHAVLHDAENGDLYIPLDHLEPSQARFEVWDSPLAEIAPMAYEYGYSLDAPEALVIWEAQFGDFSNVAQVIIDQFISSSEDKWNRLCSLVLLLPHGFEGQGPEHSSARLERFLWLCAEDNLQVVNLTTPAQLFHCLRRQVLRPLRKPLIVMSPKSLLRHPLAVSSLEELAEGGFQRVIPDNKAAAGQALSGRPVRKILLCSGKVYCDLLEARDRVREEGEKPVSGESKDQAAQGHPDVALVRLEQYYPYSEEVLREALEPYVEGTPLVWVQEEPRNMGALGFLKERLGSRLFGRFPVSYLSRHASASPATGSGSAHRAEQAELVAKALK